MRLSPGCGLRPGGGGGFVRRPFSAFWIASNTLGCAMTGHVIGGGQIVGLSTGHQRAIIFWTAGK